MGGFNPFKKDKSAAKAATRAAQTQAAAQREALEYLKETERLPQQYREEALTEMRGVYMGTPEEQQAIIDRAKSSPLYQQIMGGLDAGEDAILRNAATTGGLRSGNVQHNLADYSTQLQNKALLDSYNQQMSGLSGLAQLPSLAPQIASKTAGIGQTLAQGQIASAQANQAAKQNQFGNLMGLGGLALGMFSDRRLKSKVTKIGEVNGFNLYSWTWNSVAEKLGLTGSTVGVMADEVHDEMPEAVIIKDHFMFVNYNMIGVL